MTARTWAARIADAAMGTWFTVADVVQTVHRTESAMERFITNLSVHLTRERDQDTGNFMALVERLNRIEDKVDNMNEREQHAWDVFNEGVQDLVDGYQARGVEIDALRAEVAGLNSNVQDKVNAAVDAALEQDSQYDAERIERANAVIATGLEAPPLPSVPERAPDALPTDTVTGIQDPPPNPDGSPADVPPLNTPRDEETRPASTHSDDGVAEQSTTPTSGTVSNNGSTN